MASAKREQAIVLGGSMGGLLAARVLSEHFREVTILERDEFPELAENRRGVPQGRHTHGLLASGGQVLEHFFPGITEELVGLGVPRGDLSTNARHFLAGGLLCRAELGLNGLAVSRPCLEFAVRRRVLQLPNVRVRQGVQVEHLQASGGQVTGVVAGGESLAADLTVDATGRGSHSPQWLEAIGFERPREESIQVSVGYCTRKFKRRATDLNGDIVIIIPPTPEGKRGGVMLAQEGDRWTVTLISHFGNYPPEDLAGFIEYSRTIPAPYIYEVIRDAEPLGEGVSSRFPASIRRRYEELRRFPEGYLVFGDAISSFNPIYGQGMSASALQAMELRAVLAGRSADLARDFFRKASKVTDGPWGTAAGNDLRIPETVGERPLPVKIINWYMGKLLRAAHHDVVLAHTFQRVANLLAPPPSVLEPTVIARVIWGNLRSTPAPENVFAPGAVEPAEAKQRE